MDGRNLIRFGVVSMNVLVMSGRRRDHSSNDSFSLGHPPTNSPPVLPHLRPQPNRTIHRLDPLLIQDNIAHPRDYTHPHESSSNASIIRTPKIFLLPDSRKAIGHQAPVIAKSFCYKSSGILVDLQSQLKPILRQSLSRVPTEFET